MHSPFDENPRPRGSESPGLRCMFVGGGRWPFRRALSARESSIWGLLAILAILVLSAPSAVGGGPLQAQPRGDAGRLANDARYLSAPELQGRGIGTKGIELAADYIARRMAAEGLRVDLCDGTPFQLFPGPNRPQLGPDNRLRFVGSHGAEGATQIELTLDEDYSLLSVSGSGVLDMPLVFVGYGITAKAEGFDEYAGLDVRGKAVVILRHEPQQADPHSVLNGTQNSEHALFRRKLENARQHGAAAVIFCTDRFNLDQQLSDLKRQWQTVAERLATQQAKLEELSGDAAKSAKLEIVWLSQQSQRLAADLHQQDPLLSFHVPLGDVSAAAQPVFHCRRNAINKLLRACLGLDLRYVEKSLDAELRPQSKELTGWRLQGRADVRREAVQLRNVVGVLDSVALQPSAGRTPPSDPDALGTEPRREPSPADSAAATAFNETIVVGAHYDHLGFGGSGSLDTSGRQVHPGADDNASGVAVLLDVAHRLAAAGPLPRRVVFVAFSGEEVGLLGSTYHVTHPLPSQAPVVAMINFDMVGRMLNQRLMVLGCGTFWGFEGILDAANAGHGLQLVKMSLGATPSDQLPFVARQIPALHFFTGMHGDYHRPSDQFAKLNIDGMQQVGRLAADVVTALARLPQRPLYASTLNTPSIAPKRAFLGGVPAPDTNGPGCRLVAVLPGGPAQRAGVQSGDVIVQLANWKVDDIEDLLGALQRCHQGQQVPLTLRRGERRLTLEVTLSAGL